MDIQADKPEGMTCGVIEIPGRPQQKGSKTAFIQKGKARLMDSNKKARSFQHHVAQCTFEQWTGPPLGCAVVLTARFYFSRPKSHFGSGKNAQRLKSTAPYYVDKTPDLSKLMRLLEDGLQGIVYNDDKQVVGYRDVSKEYTEGPERTVVIVEPAVGPRDNTVLGRSFLP